LTLFFDCIKKKVVEFFGARSTIVLNTYTIGTCPFARIFNLRVGECCTDLYSIELIIRG